MNSDSPGEITQPVANARYVVVAVPNRREVVCLNLHDGSIRWTRQLTGRVAAPPTLAGDVAFVGVNDATVSAINLNDGRLIWTFFAAPYERLHNAHAQIESTHPVRSSPVLHDGLLYVAAGRHGSVDNGLHVWALDAATGQPKAHRRIDHAHTNDVMQLLVDGTLRLVATELETGKLAVRYRPAAGFGPVPVGRSNQYRGTPAEGSASKAPSINPNARGHDGGHGWIGPIPIWMGVHLTSGAGVYGMHVGPGIRCVTQQSDRFSLDLGQSKPVFEERSIEDHKQILRTFKLPVPMERQAMESCLAGAGRFHYLAARRGNAKIALGVIDPEKQTFDLAEADIASPSEELIPDGIAIAHGYVILTTSLGRVLAFKPAD